MNDERVIRPFLRWAGGKSWLVKHISEIVGTLEFNQYHEPFLGGGAVFFALAPDKGAYLSDLNEGLINAYEIVRDYPDELLSRFDSYTNESDFYYCIRSKVYESPIDRAAQFIYLNHTSYNGLYRVNLKGQYNVPFGYRSKISLCSELIESASRLLQDVTISHSDFEEMASTIGRDDLVYLDPPYTVTHNNNGFIKYNQKLFSMLDQNRLHKFIEVIKQKGAYYILSNAAHPIIENIFGNDDRVITFTRASLIGGTSAVRGRVEELVFTNIRGGFADGYLA